LSTGLTLLFVHKINKIINKVDKKLDSFYERYTMHAARKYYLYLCTKFRSYVSSSSCL